MSRGVARKWRICRSSMGTSRRRSRPSSRRSSRKFWGVAAQSFAQARDSRAGTLARTLVDPFGVLDPLLKGRLAAPDRDDRVQLATPPGRDARGRRARRGGHSCRSCPSTSSARRSPSSATCVAEPGRRVKRASRRIWRCCWSGGSAVGARLPVYWPHTPTAALPPRGRDGHRRLLPGPSASCRDLSLLSLVFLFLGRVTRTATVRSLLRHRSAGPSARPSPRRRARRGRPAALRVGIWSGDVGSGAGAGTSKRDSRGRGRRSHAEAGRAPVVAAPAGAGRRRGRRVFLRGLVVSRDLSHERRPHNLLDNSFFDPEGLGDRGS